MRESFSKIRMLESGSHEKMLRGEGGEKKCISMGLIL